MGKYANYPIGIDISHYQPKVDYAALKGKIDFAVLKMGELQYDDQPDATVQDDMLDTHIQGFYEQNIPVLVYWFHNPAWYSNWSGDIENMTPDKDKNLKLCAAILNKKILGKSYHAFVLDWERWWVDYNDYNVNGNKARSVTPTWMNKSASKFLDNLEKVFPALVGKTMVYTGQWFINDHATTAAYDWLCKRPVWPTMYRYEVHGKTFASWDALKTALGAIPDTVKPDYLNSEPEKGGGPKIVQMGIAKMPNGKYGTTAFDIDVWYGGNGTGTVVSMQKWLGFTPTSTGDTGGDDTTGGTTDNATIAALEAELAALRSDVAGLNTRVTALETWRRS